ncbi:MAG: peptidoglycan DD-metalloendopeptidase family protein, partial [Chloroflexaceae bacterium]|nr:peptidoglycan DD-metalloendopeptidase family protein [Chloroflexaceae bacterium]
MNVHRLTRGCIILLVLQLLFGSVAWGASEPSTTGLAAVVEQAVKDDLDVPSSTDIIVDNVQQDNIWASGSVFITASHDIPSPQFFLFLARFDVDSWEVALDNESLFQEWLPQVPDTLISEDERAILTSSPTLAGDGSGQLSLPYATGETWTLTGGPHVAVNGSVKNALDFAGGNGMIRAARDGVAYYQASCPNFISIVHDGGWKTTYYHVINIAIVNGQSVSREQFLGNISAQSGCGGSATGPHVHFATYLNNAPKAMHGLDIGRWTVENGADAYQGCMVKDGVRRCVGSGIYNDGSIGSGSPPPPSNLPPNKPTHLSPANGSITNNPSVKLEWKDNGDPDDGPRGSNDFAAELYRDGTKVNESGWSEATSWTINNLDPGTYTWKVKAGDGETDSGLTSAWSFTIDTVAPSGDLTLNHGWEQANSVSVPLEATASDEDSRVRDMRLGHNCQSLGEWQPFQSRLWWQLDGQHGDTASVCVQYRDAAGNESETVEKSIELNFYPAQPSSSNYRIVKDVVALSGGSQQSSNYRLSSTGGQNLASGSIATSTGYRATLGFWTVMAAGTTPPPPGLQPPMPMIPTEPMSNPVTLSWQPVSSTDAEYLVEVRDATGNVVYSSSWMSGTTWTAPPLANGSYEWRVKARANGEESDWSDSWSVTVDTGTQPLLPPTLLTPADEAVLDSNTVTFAWEAVSIPDAEYVLEVRDTDDNLVTSSGWITDTTWVALSLADGSYQWHVKVRADGEESAWSNDATVTVDTGTQPPPELLPPTLLTPADEAVLDSNTVTFAWEAVSIPDAEYLLEVRDTDDNLVTSSGWITGTTWTALSLADGSYQWRVKVRADGEESTWSAARSITIDTSGPQPLQPPTLLTPADEAVLDSNTVTFEWEAVSISDAEYVLEVRDTDDNLVTSSGWITGTTWTALSLADGSYQWRVKVRADG